MAQVKVSTVYYVSPTAKGTSDGSSWDNATTLTNALNTAQAGDQIWVQGFESVSSSDNVYFTSTDEGFVLKSGVRLYGGFAGTETNIDERQTLGEPYKMKYCTLLTGDMGKNDQYDDVNLIFSANTSRSDNATHVLKINMEPSSGLNTNGYATIVNGFSIGSGHADGQGEKGGGIFITGNNENGGNYRIERCLVTHNYATEGGGIYVDSSVKNVNNGESLISQCAIYNNAAGVRSSLEDEGGGIYLAGAGTVVNSAIFNNENGGLCLSSDAKVVNSTVTRNTGGGIDMVSAPGSNQFNVFNTVIWGNSLLYSVTSPKFKYSAYNGADESDGNNNLSLSNYNYENDQSPYFEAPSSRTGFDRDFKWDVNIYPLWSWAIQSGSYLVDRGHADYYLSSYGQSDMGGDVRVSGPGICIGAYEYQYLPMSRIRYVKQGGTGDGTSWENASGNLQNMINDLANNNPQNQAGEVWVAAGTYVPQEQVISGATYSASFRMRDGISVYGGFNATNPEATKSAREKKKGGMPWDFVNRTILQSSVYMASNTNWSEADNKWAVNSDSRHVVFFAPLPSENKTNFDNITTLNGVTIRGGYAQGGMGADDFLTDRGAGVYMSANAYLDECVVTENSATGNGGGIYLNGGRVLNSLAYNNNSDGNGGGVYVDNAGIVLASMLSNNSANNGAGVYLDHNKVWSDGQMHPEYLILSTSIISNNTSRENGAVYCNRGGIVQQSTITNNYCPTATDNVSTNASQTGGLYINEYGLVFNSVIWNNLIKESNVPMYAKNPTAAKVRFLYNGISGINNAIWNNTYLQEMIALSETNEATSEGVIDPEFSISSSSTNITDESIQKAVGVQPDWKYNDGNEGIDFYWEPITGSNLRARGMTLGGLPSEVLMAPELDITNELFAQKPSLGAYNVDATPIKPAETADALILYIDADCTDPTHDGDSWATAYRSLNEALAYFAGLGADQVGGKRLEIHVLEGDLWPHYAYTNLDPKTATISIPVTTSGQPIEIYGGYRRDDTDVTNNTVLPRNPLAYRSILNANHDGKVMEDGLYHCVTVAAGAKAVIDGFHVINGYAAGEASRQYGAGLLVHDGANVTLSNCIFENNIAVEGAAIDARGATLAMNNCVVNNNTNTTETSAVINCPNLTLNHVTVVNNIGAAPTSIGSSSFSAGNTSGNSLALDTQNEAGAKNFANPTNAAGATLGFNTYLGGYSEFRPLTSSADAANSIINKVETADGLSYDIMTNERNLGGVPDLGAYEAILPKAGKVIYVRSYNQDPISEETEGNPDFDLLHNNPNIVYDGSTWDRAINGNAVCDLEKNQGSNDFYVRDGNSLIRASVERDDYANTGQTYGPMSNFYSGFWDSNSKNTKGNTTNLLQNEREERYVSGLQYAVEKAREANESISADEEPVVVWVGAGVYTDYKGFVIRDGVKVYGGFPRTGNPGEKDRKPLLSSYIPKNEENENLATNDYETILQIRKENPVIWGNNPTTSSFIKNITGTVRHYVLYQPDVCLSTWAPDNNNTGYKGANSYRYPGSGSGYIDNQYYTEYTKGALWDGFTVRHGYIKNYAANRDGGAGIRTFRGVTLQNMVIVNNYNHGSRSRGAGLYMDGLNSTISNSFLLNNMVDGGDSYGGGAYMIVGTGYNLAVANNYSSKAGGGLFIESATFYNNTVAFNKANGAVSTNEGNGSGLFQYADDGTGRLSSLLLYNCLFYGNEGSGSNKNFQISSNATSTFDNAHNCYVAGSIYSGLSDKFLSEDGNKVGAGLGNPFDSGVNARSENNYRLSSNSTCVNGGSEIENVILPSTDMDYTARIKDCTIDIGAYERSNQDNVQPDADGVYYVTQNGAGNACGDSEENAACAMKLQEVLNAAGERVRTGQPATVKIAGYEGGSFLYSANTLSNPKDPQSYTYVVPYGVTVMGGYCDLDEDWNDDADGYKRDPITYKTILSAINNSATLEQEVNGYHTVTFGEKPDGWTGDDMESIVDGVYLINGKATSLAGTGNPNTRGGGAIVPAWAHVRNCVVARCEAVQGGGLYVMPGGIVSGTLIMENKAEEGAGVYADNTDAGAANRAHMVSCTVTNNDASSVGGGLYLKDGAIMVTNSVLWGNTAPSDKNISGVLSEAIEDNVWSQIESGITEFYPINHSFVETYEMASNFENTTMESNEDLYFASSTRQLKAYSPLIKHGMDTKYQDKMAEVLGIADVDIQGISRVQDGSSRIDAGAYAFEGGIIPTDILLTRIFVSQGANVQLPDNVNIEDYIGRSFYTSLTWLDDALEYIKAVRNNGIAKDDTKFEILLAKGTYKPSYRRTDAGSTTIDQRQNSYVIPQGVSIYGGFNGAELISSTADGKDKITSIPNVSGTFVCNGDITDILGARVYSDFNQNGINEPWEFANQVILSGNVNVSDQVKNVYHVVYSDAGTSTTANPVVLDGLTVMDGETFNILSDASATDEVGRGGGIYSNGVSYLLNRCRLINNFAVRGGAVYIRDAKLTIINSILAGNGTVEEPVTNDYQPPKGGAVYIAGVSGNPKIPAALYAVNTLWVNNETAGYGGAIGTNYAEGIVTHYDPAISLMNNTFARNKAEENAVIYHHNAKNTIVNTLMWGNESEKDDLNTDEENLFISYSASDRHDLTAKGNTNIKLSADNTSVTGPRFAKPSTVAGVAGNDANNQWNPAAISILTDAGDGLETADGASISGAYDDWWTDGLSAYEDLYMTKNDGNAYLRYAGPLTVNGTQDDKPIDIGVYEYQYELAFPKMNAIYVATTESGKADGTNWANATSDLRGAVVAMANPTGGELKDKAVYIKAGEYSWSRISAGTAFTVSMSTVNDYGTSLTIKGSYNESGIQDFSQPTVITTQESNVGSTELLMAVAAGKKPVDIEGLTFINKNPNGGTGLQVSSVGGKVTLKQTAFRGNKESGLNIVDGTDGEVLLVNTLFADGGTGLNGADSRTTVVNATFVNNASADITGTAKGVYNSVSWNNGDLNLATDNTNKNVAIAGNVANDDVNNGPNFRDPDNEDIYSRDYRIRPSVNLLNNGSNQHYAEHALGLTADDAVIPVDEKDLGNNSRLVDTSIDIGAYEYEAPLQPIVYVKPDLTGTTDGKSWETALGDLQGAVDLAGLYAKEHQSLGYVFVHGNYHDDTGSLSLSLGDTKVYGGMNDERSDTPLEDDFSNTTDVVNSLLGKRRGILESNNRSMLQDVSIDADGIVDGFVVNGTATVNNGALSTSVVNNDVSGATDGLLYNSLVLGDGTTAHPGNVGGVKAVNVTATGAIADITGNGNNRSSVNVTNSYVTDDYWKYQLMDTSEDIDPEEDRMDISGYMTKVGHERDLIGNRRIRNAVDNGCFETWNIADAGNVVTSADYPVGKSVVYVRKGWELGIVKASDGTFVYPEGNAFNPGFLLLEHQAGLRGNGNYISLTNFAVERYIPDGSADLVAMPFDVNSATSVLAGLTPKRYDGSIRAQYNYKYDAEEGSAWTDSNIDYAGMYEGLLFENTTGSDQTLRFYGKASAPYTENGTDKMVSLQKYNYNDSWSTGNPGAGNRFTHKENMSWNLFGSPYLCAMNYEDLQYGRVLYGYNNGSYQTIKTYGDDGGIVDGHIPAGSAVFTQTATLKDEETFTVKHPYGATSDKAFGNISQLRLALYAAANSRSTGMEVKADVLQLNTVESSKARNEFDISADGVKWMNVSDSMPQVYAERNGGRYSLLSAVNEIGEVAVGVTLPEPGMYTFSIPETCDAVNYESVILKDSKTGKQTNLLDGSYDFTSAEGGDISGRFTVSFNRMLDDGKNSAIRAWSSSRDRVSVSGVDAGDRIAVYSADGVQAASRVASSSAENIQASVSGVAVVEITREGRTIAVRKVKMK